MSEPNFIILYVNDPVASASFYAGLLAKEPIEASPTFAMFALASGVMLGLWSRHTVEPSPGAAGCGGELAISVPGNEVLERLYQDWRGRGLPIIQAPTDMDFGPTFVALDPDGHRLRVFVPQGA